MPRRARDAQHIKRFRQQCPSLVSPANSTRHYLQRDFLLSLAIEGALRRTTVFVVADECHHITWATPVLATFSRSNVLSGTSETYDHGLKNSIRGAISEYDGQARDMTTARSPDCC
jgi:hypothetical protein